MAKYGVVRVSHHPRIAPTYQNKLVFEAVEVLNPFCLILLLRYIIIIITYFLHAMVNSAART